MTLTQKILTRDNYRCAYHPGRANTMDHIFSKAEGRRWGIARDDEQWIVAACHTCNHRRGTRRLLPPSWAHRQAELEELTGKKWQIWSGDPAELGAEKVLI